MPALQALESILCDGCRYHTLMGLANIPLLKTKSLVYHVLVWNLNKNGKLETSPANLLSDRNFQVEWKCNTNVCLNKPSFRDQFLVHRCLCSRPLTREWSQFFVHVHVNNLKASCSFHFAISWISASHVFTHRCHWCGLVISQIGRALEGGEVKVFTTSVEKFWPPAYTRCNILLSKLAGAEILGAYFTSCKLAFQNSCWQIIGASSPDLWPLFPFNFYFRHSFYNPAQFPKVHTLKGLHAYPC